MVSRVVKLVIRGISCSKDGMMEKHETMTFLRMYYNNFPIVLNINHSFSNFEETSTHFNHNIMYKNHFELFLYIILIITLLLLF